MYKVILSLLLFPLFISGFSQSHELPWFNKNWYDENKLNELEIYQITILKNDTLKRLDKAYSYNAKRKSLTIDYFDENGQRLKKAKQFFTFNNCGKVTPMYSANPELLDCYALGIADTSYHYNSSTYTTDSLARIVKIESDTVYNGKDQFHITVKDYVYNEFNCILQTTQKVYYPNQMVRENVSYFTYDNQNRLIEINSIQQTMKGKTTYKTIVDYKKKQVLLSKYT